MDLKTIKSPASSQDLQNNFITIKNEIESLKGNQSPSLVASKVLNDSNTSGNFVKDALNTLLGYIGTISTLTTTIKTNIVSSINEIVLNLTTHISDTNNPHSLTKEQIGLSEVTNDAQIKRSEMGVPNGVPTLDTNGKVNINQLPALAITDTFPVNSQAEMLALSCEVGDIAIISDPPSSYILKTYPPNILENWEQLKVPSGSVISVSGKTGVVTLAKSDVGLDNVVNLDTSTTANINDSLNKRFVIDSEKTAISHTNRTVLDGTEQSFTTVLKTKLDNIEANAEVNNISDTNATELTDSGDTSLHYHFADRDRENHTGTQLASTISDFSTAVGITILTGLVTTTNAIISATDTVIGALGKLQKQIIDNLTTLTNHTSNASNPHSVTKSQVGLGNVDNTSDLNKPISTTTQTALDGKASTSHKSTHATGGTDALSPSDIGAALANDLSAHLTESTSQFIEIVRDLSLTGIQTITTASGRKVKSMILFGNVANTKKISVGMYDSTGNGAIYCFSDTGNFGNSSYTIAFSDLSTTNRTLGMIQNVVDGSFDINWTHTGSGATGTCSIKALVFYHD